MSHPHHLTSSWSSALIPFCAFKTELNFTQRSHPLNGTSFPLCSSFVPTVLEGQLCYELTLNKKSGQGKTNGLMFLLDYNEDRSLHVPSLKVNTTRTSNETINFGMAFESIRVKSAKVQINSLSPYIGFGEGVYKMTAVKRMTSNEDFLNMLLEDRNCEIELYENCRTRKLLKKCNCVPWELPLGIFKVKINPKSFVECFITSLLRTSKYVTQKDETALRVT